jgi:biotin carboxyl carrier protein
MRKFKINVNGNQYEVEVEEVTSGAQPSPAVKPAPKATPAPKAAPQPKPVEEKKEVMVSEGEEAIEAPMPGTILSINVKEGDMVKSGQILLILEAMKMENEILAPRDGKVVSIGTTKGASVNTGEKLVVIE